MWPTKPHFVDPFCSPTYMTHAHVLYMEWTSGNNINIASFSRTTSQPPKAFKSLHLQTHTAHHEKATTATSSQLPHTKRKQSYRHNATPQHAHPPAHPLHPPHPRPRSNPTPKIRNNDLVLRRTQQRRRPVQRCHRARGWDDHARIQDLEVCLCFLLFGREMLGIG